MSGLTYTANNYLNPKLIPELSNNLGGKASDVMLKHLHKSKLYCPCNYYNNNKTEDIGSPKNKDSKPWPVSESYLSCTGNQLF